MRIALLIPGTGNFYCGSCLRNTALAKALRRAGHDAEIVPLYLPFFVEDEAVDTGGRIHMGGINMYLQQKAPALRHLPSWLRRWLDAPGLLRWASSKSDMVGAHSLGAMTVSMLRGEAGRQQFEIEQLVRFLRERPPYDVVCLSDALLIGLARRLKEALGCPLVCTLQGEAPFLDALPEPWRATAWSELAERAQAIDAFVAVSAHYGELMRSRLGLAPERVHMVHNGIELDGLAPGPGFAGEGPPTIGYLARMCPEKGLHTLVDAFVALRRRGTLPGLHLAVAGTCVRADEVYVEEQRAKLEAAGLAADAEFFPNIEREDKLRFLASLSVLSVPATYGESFGLYVLEALAAGVPVVQPRHGAFPEVLAATGGGTLVEPDDATSLADGLEQLLRNPERRRALATAGRNTVLERFGVDRMARDFAVVCKSVTAARTPAFAPRAAE